MNRNIQSSERTNKIIAAIFAASIVTLMIVGELTRETSHQRPTDHGVSERVINSVAFPKVREQDDVDDILEDYPPYLEFVLGIGKHTSRSQAARLSKIFNELKRRDEAQAARFLKGLRFEMVQKLQFSGLSPERASSSNSNIRRWVTRFLPLWNREADEYLFRAKTNALVKR